MTTKSRKSPASKGKNDETPNKPLVEKAASRKGQEKNEELGQAIKTSQKKGHTKKQRKDYPTDADPKLQKFEDLGSRIAQRAYELYERRGGDHGHDLDDWMKAERQILMEEEN